MPSELPAALQQLWTERELLHVPLPRRDDLERPLAALVELHDVADALRLADEIARIGEELRDPASSLLGRHAGDLVLHRRGARGIPRRPARLAPARSRDRAVALHDDPRRQL